MSKLRHRRKGLACSHALVVGGHNIIQVLQHIGHELFFVCRLSVNSRIVREGCGRLGAFFRAERKLELLERQHQHFGIAAERVQLPQSAGVQTKQRDRFALVRDAQQIVGQLLFAFELT
ncbi:MAG TPA: hypothetical protein VEJ47_20690 [Candidatus Eremiobacteraceae bacterium]|nr:hypothetical protein [Candidatus Eremiobacteraceae bacterium]